MMLQTKHKGYRPCRFLPEYFRFPFITLYKYDKSPGRAPFHPRGLIWTICVVNIVLRWAKKCRLIKCSTRNAWLPWHPPLPKPGRRIWRHGACQISRSCRAEGAWSRTPARCSRTSRRSGFWESRLPCHQCGQSHSAEAVCSVQSTEIAKGGVFAFAYFQTKFSKQTWLKLIF